MPTIVTREPSPRVSRAPSGMARAQATGMDAYHEHLARMRTTAAALTDRLARLAAYVQAADARIANLQTGDATEDAALAAAWTAARAELERGVLRVARAAETVLADGVDALTNASQPLLTSTAARLGVRPHLGPGH